MFSVSPEIYSVLSRASRWLFAFIALLLLFLSLSWLYGERKKRRERFRSLPEAGNIGEMVVISGSDQLPADTWFPVPREGILGSLRSCDLVVPCPGVRARHLSFSWLDGTGLVVRPFSGCETIVDGVPLTASGKSDMPVMVHGSCLQVGSAVLRLQLLSALNHTNRAFMFPAAEPESMEQIAVQPSLSPASPPQETEFIPAGQNPPESVFSPYPQNPVPGIPAGHAAAQVFPPDPAGPAETADAPEPPVSRGSAPRRKRADRWKEDFSE